MEKFSQKLIAWYKENGRELPWRQTADPYRIWISEIILQQTRVSQGYDYYLKFVERFPDFRTLADADEDEVMRYWQGLGYYSRARNLHQAARDMKAMGRFPTLYKEVRALKGIGDYTAAAICSFAYGLPYAVVDGNVYRVLSRWRAIDEPIDGTAGKKFFAALAQGLLDKKEPALFNQAIMDLGAMVCTPSSPDCAVCPLAADCLARFRGNMTDYPVKAKKTKVTERHFHYLFIHDRTCTFLRRREEKDIWRNLYELPLIEVKEDCPDDTFLQSEELKSFLQKHGISMGCEVNLLQKRVKHVLSHQQIFASFYEITLPDGGISLPGYQRVELADLHKFPVCRLINRFFSVLLAGNKL